jgi:hypothetical protein
MKIIIKISDKWLSNTHRFFDSIILKYIFSIKMTETIYDQLESCRYDVSVNNNQNMEWLKAFHLSPLVATKSATYAYQVIDTLGYSYQNN